MTRRVLLGSTIAAAVVPSTLVASLNATRDKANFVSLLYTLAGPVEVAPALLESVEALFVEKYGQAALKALLAHLYDNGGASALDPQDDADIEAQIQWLTAALFTGSADPSDPKSKMINYPYALCWKGLAFAKAPGLCAGPEFGYWSTDWGQRNGGFQD